MPAKLYPGGGVKVSVTISPVNKLKLRLVAKRSGRNLSAVVNSLLEYYPTDLLIEQEVDRLRQHLQAGKPLNEFK